MPRILLFSKKQNVSKESPFSPTLVIKKMYIKKTRTTKSVKKKKKMGRLRIAAVLLMQLRQLFHAIISKNSGGFGMVV